VAGGKPHDAWCLSVSLPNVSQAGLKPASGGVAALCFVSVTWHGQAFHRLGVQDVKVFILLAALFLPSVAPASKQGFGVSELTLSASVPYLPCWISHLYPLKPMESIN
jgi:hypothetical protein